MNLRRFNKAGLDEFKQLLMEARPTEIHQRMEDILEEGEFSKCLDVEWEVEKLDFSSRFELGEYLYTGFQEFDFGNSAYEKGVWTWLSAFFFPVLHPANRPKEGVGELAKWVPDKENFRKYYRHLLVGPFEIVRAHFPCHSRVKVLLANPPYQPGDVAEQLASRQELVTNNTVMQVATDLYVDQETGRLKRGAAEKITLSEDRRSLISGQGSVRHLVPHLRKLDLSWDLHYLDPSELLSLLPRDFQRFQT